MRLLFLVAMLCAASVSFAQWNPNGATTGPIYYTGGSVGIGTTTPSSLLHLEGSSPILTIKTTANNQVYGVNLVSETGYSRLSINGYGSAYVSNSFARANGVSLHTTADAAASAGLSIAARNTSGYITFHSGGDTERMRIDPSGNVGIGITTPEAKLHVKGVAYFGNENGNSWHRVAIGGSGTNYGSIGYGYKYTTTSHDHVYSVNDYASQLRFDAGGFNFFTAPTGTSAAVVTFTNAMSIKQNGEINIGSSNSVVTGYGSKLNFLGASSNGDPLWISRYNTTDNVSELRLNIGDDNGEDMFVVGNHYWSGNVWRAHLAVKSNGNIGIGTTSPTQKLEVNGTVYSREVKVDLAAGTGPDYVFEPTYNLPTLAETEAYIKANKHLPEVPSAKEMEANGINLSEMNMLLLKKVEELTLYLIEMQKQNVEQQKEIELLKSKVK